MPATSRQRGLCHAAVVYQLVSSAMAATNVAMQLTSVSPPATQYVDRSFAGFGIEPSNLFAFTGGADTNTLSMNLLGNLGNYTGESLSTLFLLCYGHPC